VLTAFPQFGNQSIVAYRLRNFMQVCRASQYPDACIWLSGKEIWYGRKRNWTDHGVYYSTRNSLTINVISVLLLTRLNAVQKYYLMDSHGNQPYTAIRCRVWFLIRTGISNLGACSFRCMLTQLSGQLDARSWKPPACRLYSMTHVFYFLDISMLEQLNLWKHLLEEPSVQSDSTQMDVDRNLRLFSLPT
jgi:hypothetical protein